MYPASCSMVAGNRLHPPGSLYLICGGKWMDGVIWASQWIIVALDMKWIHPPYGFCTGGTQNWTRGTLFFFFFWHFQGDCFFYFYFFLLSLRGFPKIGWLFITYSYNRLSVMNSFILDRERYAALNHTLSLITFTCKSLFFFFFFAVSNAAHHIHQENTDICNKLWTFHSVLHVVIFVLSFFFFKGWWCNF